MLVIAELTSDAVIEIQIVNELEKGKFIKKFLLESPSTYDV